MFLGKSESGGLVVYVDDSSAVLETVLPKDLGCVARRDFSLPYDLLFGSVGA